MSVPENKKKICYRCRGLASADKSLLSCSLCNLFWHLECVLPTHLPSLTEGDWVCPHHPPPTEVKPKKGSSKRSSKAKARADIIESFEEADEILKYGGVAHEISEEAIENEFFNYARRYRKYNGAESRLETNVADNNFGDEIQTEGEEWLDGLTPTQIDELKYDGVQMLIDAAQAQASESSPNGHKKIIDPDRAQYEHLTTLRYLNNSKKSDDLDQEQNQRFTTVRTLNSQGFTDLDGEQSEPFINIQASSDEQKTIDLDEKEYERFAAIQALVDSQGEEALLKILSQHT